MQVTVHPPGYDPLAQPQPVAAPSPAAQPAPQSMPVQRPAQPGLNYTQDSQGRTIGWKRMSALDDFELIELAGSANADNPAWLAVASLAFSVREIDGEPVSRPASKAALKAMIGRLDTAGLQAVADVLSADAEAQRGVERAGN